MDRSAEQATKQNARNGEVPWAVRHGSQGRRGQQDDESVEEELRLSSLHFDQLDKTLDNLARTRCVGGGTCAIKNGSDPAGVVGLGRILRHDALVLWRDERFQYRRFMDSWFDQYRINPKRLQFVTVTVGKSFQRKLGGAYIPNTEQRLDLPRNLRG